MNYRLLLTLCGSLWRLVVRHDSNAAFLLIMDLAELLGPKDLRQLAEYFLSLRKRMNVTPDE